LSFFQRRAAEMKIVINAPKWLETMQDGVAWRKLTKSFTGAPFLVSSGDPQVRRARRAPTGCAADH